MGTLERLLARIEISPSEIVATERISGLTNANYLVKTHDDEVIVRIASEKSAEVHGMSRNVEAQVLRSAQAAGLGVEILFYELPDGHLVTRKLAAETYETAPARFQEHGTFAEIVERVKLIHELPAVDHIFDPFAKVERTVAVARQHGVKLPEGVTRLLANAQRIGKRWYPLDPSSTALCHNDLFSVNILQTGPPRFIDWEFVGMGDVFFDLATLLVACDDAHPLGLEYRTIALDAYFGEVSDSLLAHLDDMTFMVRLHASMWGIVQQVLRVREPEGFTYKDYAAYMFAQLIAEL